MNILFEDVPNKLCDLLKIKLQKYWLAWGENFTLGNLLTTNVHVLFDDVSNKLCDLFKNKCPKSLMQM